MKEIIKEIKMAEQPPQAQEFRYIVRIGNTDLNGNKRVLSGLTKIKGINFMFANAVCHLAKVDKQKKLGYLTEKETRAIDTVLENPAKHGCPVWIVNHKNDYEDGENKHFLKGDLMFNQDNDIKRMRKIRCYKGVRHSLGLPARGQRTRSNFRKNKGNVMGVQRKKVAASQKSDDKKK